MMPRPVRANLPIQRDITWPEWPKLHQQLSGALFEERPALRKLVVLVDAELLASDEDVMVSPHVLLTGLLTHPYLQVFRYRDDGPLPGISRRAYRNGALIAVEGWAELLPRHSNGGRAVVYADAIDAGYAGIFENGVTFARQDSVPFIYADLDPEVAADKREKDVLAAEVSQVVQADIFITERPYLYAARGVMAQGVTVCRLLEALALIGLYLRSQKQFIMWCATDGIVTMTNEWRYYDIATRDLLPAAWQWSSICTEASKIRQDDALRDLGGSVWRRIQRVLRTRDQFHRVYRQIPNNDTGRSLLSDLDSILVSLMGATDGTARVAHVLFEPTKDIRDAGWQRRGWLKALDKAVPALAALFRDDTPFRYIFDILAPLRNTVHGQMMQFITVHHSVGLRDTFITLPNEVEDKVINGMDSLGGPGAWGVFTRADRQMIDAEVFLEQVLPRVLELINGAMQATTAEYLKRFPSTPLSPMPIADQHGPFSERNRCSIRWQLGLLSAMMLFSAWAEERPAQYFVHRRPIIRARKPAAECQWVGGQSSL